jgi:hypothetical protein
MIKQIAAGVVVGCLAFLPVSADASTTPKHYKNCTAVHKVYKHGIARAHYHEKGGGLKGKPHVSTKLYNANKKMDRDKDGVACEA